MKVRDDVWGWMRAHFWPGKSGRLTAVHAAFGQLAKHVTDYESTYPILNPTIVHRPQPSSRKQSYARLKKPILS